MFALLQFLLDQFGNYLLFIIISLSVELNARDYPTTSWIYTLDLIITHSVVHYDVGILNLMA